MFAIEVGLAFQHKRTQEGSPSLMLVTSRKRLLLQKLHTLEKWP